MEEGGSGIVGAGTLGWKDEEEERGHGSGSPVKPWKALDQGRHAAGPGTWVWNRENILCLASLASGFN